MQAAAQYDAPQTTLKQARRERRPDQPLHYVKAAQDRRAVQAHAERVGRTAVFVALVLTSLDALGRHTVKLCAGGVLTHADVRHALRNLSRPTRRAHVQFLLGAGVLKDTGDGVELSHFASMHHERGDDFWQKRRAHQLEAGRMRQARFRARGGKVFATDPQESCPDSNTLPERNAPVYKTRPLAPPDADASTKDFVSARRLPEPIPDDELDAIERALLGEPEPETGLSEPQHSPDPDALSADDAAVFVRLRARLDAPVDNPVAVSEPSPSDPEQQPSPFTIRRNFKRQAARGCAVPLVQVHAVLAEHAHVIAPGSVNAVAIARRASSYDIVRQAADLTAEAVRSKRIRKGAGPFMLGTVRKLEHGWGRA